MIAHRRRPLAMAFALNTGVLAVEAILLSLAPVAAGVLVLASGWSMFDSVIAVIIGAVIIGTTARTALTAHRELLWPENVRCGH